VICLCGVGWVGGGGNWNSAMLLKEPQVLKFEWEMTGVFNGLHHLQGASFNPSQNFAFAAAGKGAITLHALRSVSIFSLIFSIQSISGISLSRRKPKSGFSVRSESLHRQNVHRLAGIPCKRELYA
jgi:hypothetical protein